MTMRVLGISGSPIRHSNTDRAVQMVLEETGLEYEFIKLSQYKLEPCRGCLGCKDSNQCVLKDDGAMLAEKFDQADAVVVGGFTPYGSLDARTKTFMERMYCLRHQQGKSRNKVGAAVITTACPPEMTQLPPASQIATQQFAIWMLEEGMINVGSIVLVGNLPCIRCGYGDQCSMSGVQMLHGPDATVASMGVHQFPTHEQNQQQARELGQKIRQTLTQRFA